MPRLVGFGTFVALLEEQLSEKISRRILAGDQGMIVWWSIGAGVHVEPHSHANEQIVWILKLEFRLAANSGSAAGGRRRHSGRYGARGVVPRSTEVIDFFAPPRDDFLVGGKPAYMSVNQPSE
jgi:hypothetical protein